MPLTSLVLLALLAADPAPTAAAPAPETKPEPAAPAAPAATPAPAPEAKPAPAKPPKDLLAGSSGTWRPFILAHTWFTFDRAYSSTTCPPATDKGECMANALGFRFRRVEMGVSGALFDGKVQYKAAIEPMRALEFLDKPLKIVGSDGVATGETVTASQPFNATSIFNDMTVTYVTAYADVTLGQFRIPVSWEGYGGSAKLLLPERAYAGTRYGDRRDIGLRVGKSFKHFSYGVFLLNGAGQNKVDLNVQKDVALRLEAYPVEGLMIGLVGYTSVGDLWLAGSKQRAEIDVRFERGPYLVHAEAIRGWDHAKDHLVTDSYGFHVGAGYTPVDFLQVGVRYGRYNPQMGTSNKGGKGADVVEGGLNWFIYKNEAKLSLSYSAFLWSDDVPASHSVILCNQLNF